MASSYSNELVYATLPDIPTGLVATASASSVSLTWTAAPVQAGILGYRIYRSTTAGGPYAQVGSVAGNVSTFPDSPGAGQRYYVIDATSISGASAKSAEATAVTGAAAPVAAGPSRGPDATKVSADGEMPRAGIRRPPPPERLPARR